MTYTQDAPAEPLGVAASPRIRRRIPRVAELAPLMKPRPFIWNPTARRLARALTLGDIREIARRRSPRAVFDYAAGGAENERSMARSSESFQRIEFRPKALQDVAAVDTSTVILGERSQLPLIFAPTGFTRMMHHQGERAVARAAARAGIPYTLSTMGTTSIEEIAETIPSGQKWFQLYLWRDREASIGLVNRAWKSGFSTLVLTVDTPVAGARLRDIRNGMTIPPTLTPRTVLDGAIKPSWWINFLTTEPLNFASLKSWNGTVAELANQMFDPSATFEDIAWLRERWPGKLVIKGIQSVDDAILAVEAGAEAIVLSNHGGRQLDRSPVPLEILGDVREAIGDRAQIFIDGSIMSGADIAASVCLGADAVLVGRAYLYGLMAAGEAGVDRVAEILGQETKRTMQLLGAHSVCDLTGERARLRS